MTLAPELISSLALSLTPAERAKAALLLVQSLVDSNVSPSGAQWALVGALPDLKRAAAWMEQSEERARLSDEQRRQLCVAEVDEEGT
jgi:cephalosporin-C deacetylase-like acetyl esterase